MKIAFTGTHGTGKTTAVYEMASAMKKNPIYSGKSIGILLEVPRHCPFSINTSASDKSQLWMFTTQIQQELELSRHYDILICDRCIMDPIAYAKYNEQDELVESSMPLALYHMKTYDEIIFKTIINNDYLFEDGVRDTGKEFRQGVEEILLDLFKENDINVMYI